MTHICVSKLCHHWFRLWLVAWPAPSHYLNQCWNIVNWTLRNKLQWNLNRNSNIFIEENDFESVVCETASILSRPQCVNTHYRFRPHSSRWQNVISLQTLDRRIERWTNIWYWVKLISALKMFLSFAPHRWIICIFTCQYLSAYCKYLQYKKSSRNSSLFLVCPLTIRKWLSCFVCHSIFNTVVYFKVMIVG